MKVGLLPCSSKKNRPNICNARAAVSQRAESGQPPRPALLRSSAQATHAAIGSPNTPASSSKMPTTGVQSRARPGPDVRSGGAARNSGRRAPPSWPPVPAARALPSSKGENLAPGGVAGIPVPWGRGTARPVRRSIEDSCRPVKPGRDGANCACTPPATMLGYPDRPADYASEDGSGKGSASVYSLAWIQPACSRDLSCTPAQANLPEPAGPGLLQPSRCLVGIASAARNLRRL
jgi:hypothetical protein